MELLAILFGLFLIFLIIALVIGAVLLTLFLLTNAIIASRISFSLLVGFILNSSVTLIPGGGIWNTLLLSVIVFAVIMLLSQMERLDYALKFLCTSVMAILIPPLCALLSAPFFSPIRIPPCGCKLP